MRPMMAWAHDLRCIPTSLANKIPAASNSRGGYSCAKTSDTDETNTPNHSPLKLQNSEYCLLYTSQAADETPSLDLAGPRNIK